MQSIWYELECVPIEPDPFARLSNLYAIHEKDKTLAADCAMAEGLGKEPLPALRQAYAYNNERAVVTQSALACQTLNRTLTLIALCECSCLVADGAPVPEEFVREGRIVPLIESLADKPYRHLLGKFAFDLLHGWGGMWMWGHTVFFEEAFAADIEAKVTSVRALIDFTNDLFKKAGQEGYIVGLDFYGEWSNILLPPYFAKGIGVGRFERELGLTLASSPWCDWRAEAERFHDLCIETE